MAADVVINVDLPWNPARLEQRIARAHRIGSKRPVQELLLVASESIEERILQLHETKRTVLANIWARSGEDVIAAPGGSGSFKEMVHTLVADGSQSTRGEGDQSSATDRGPASESRGGQEAVLQRDAADAEEPAGASAPRSSIEPAAVTPPVDQAVLAAAVAAIAPALPEAHRRSLAAVFRALASTLESGVGGLG